MDVKQENGEPTGATNTTDTTAPPAEERLTFTRSEFNAVLNSAIASHVRRLDSKFEKRITEALAAARGQAPQPVADDDQTKAMQLVETMRAEREREAAAATARERELLAREERNEVEYQLAQLGATVNTRGARAILQEDERIGRNATGELIFRADDGSEVPLADGLRSWLNTDDGKAHRPALGGGVGSGTVIIRGGADRLRTAEPSKHEQRQEATQALSKWFVGLR